MTTLAVANPPSPSSTTGDDGHFRRLAALRTRLDDAGMSAVTLCANRNRRIALSLRGRPGHRRVSVHADLLDDAELLDALPSWIAASGRDDDGHVRAALIRLDRRWRFRDGSIGPLPPCPAGLVPIGTSFDIAAAVHRIHGTWFRDLPLPRVRWSRATAGPIRHIRFGSYRPGDPATIALHPRLDQPWVAAVFVDHVIHHEFCHHRQACSPLRGEGPHSRRFRDWERSYPHHADAVAWQRHHLGDFLIPPSQVMHAIV